MAPNFIPVRSSVAPVAESSGSRKWRAVLLLAIMYGMGLAMKFALLVLKVPLTTVASFDDTLKWAMVGMSGAVSTFVLATGLEDYATKRGPTVQPQQAQEINNNPPAQS